ncbi:hypothetical protein [Bradyrhizobium sp. CCBAU 51627]|uniref:hypothetical protein n=1 Tax=Bradyrhizobium sp. CCBAU 51627 TaxID=1325088 RepID=UPI0023050616|nr:hypothetical protein [Bradyrhizobium sp. CCBAU 51627]MDA9430229.1 hypothetical protein [Bradyrhizobium sp. CCBAU 51627]
MRFTKSEILDEFARQDRSYRLAIISSHWLQGGAQYKPSAVEEARGLQMKVLDTWVSYSDLAMLLERDSSRFSITTDFVLNQLHALIRVPFELLSDYCEDFDRAGSGSAMVKKLRDADWYEYARVIRNTVSHNFRFDFSRYKPEKFPITWRGISLTPDLDRKTITFESFWHKSGYELFVAMRDFAEALPE